MVKCTGNLKSCCSPIKILSTGRLYPSVLQGYRTKCQLLMAQWGCSSSPGQRNIRIGDFWVKLSWLHNLILEKYSVIEVLGLHQKDRFTLEMTSRKSAVQSLGRRKVDVVCFAVMTLQLKTCILHFAVQEHKLFTIGAIGLVVLVY